MKIIGGYFELELNKGQEFHKDALRLNTGRNAFEYILRTNKYSKVLLPYYTCDNMIEPLEKIGINYDYYMLDEKLYPVLDFSKLNENDVLVYINYFGVFCT